MALYAVSIEKETTYHGQPERFSNIYYFQGPEFQAGDANYKRVCDALVAAERPIHNGEVQFKMARIWSAGGTALQNVTLGMFDYVGPGTMEATILTHAETAVLVEWECGRANILGRKVYLRKYIRSQAMPPFVAESVARGKTALPADKKAIWKTYADKVQLIEPVVGTAFVLCSPSNRTPKASNNGFVNDFVVSREFRRN
jgi:hypothetical protein